MDALKYLDAKQNGLAAITLQGESTLLVSIPAGFDPANGRPLPNEDRGYQRADIEAMRAAAVATVDRVTAELAKAQASVAAFDQVLVEVADLVK